MDKSFVLKEIAEKQRQLDMLIAVEEIAANQQQPFYDYMCNQFGSFEMNKARKSGCTDEDCLRKIYYKAQHEFFVFILSTQGITWKSGERNHIVPFDKAVAEDISDSRMPYTPCSLGLFKAVWIDFMILMLEDEILELMGGESLLEEVPGVPEDMPVPQVPS